MEWAPSTNWGAPAHPHQARAQVCCPTSRSGLRNLPCTKLELPRLPGRENPRRCLPQRWEKKMEVKVKVKEEEQEVLLWRVDDSTDIWRMVQAMVRDIYRNSVTGIASRPLLLALATPCCSRRPARRGEAVALWECLRRGLDPDRPRELAAISTSWSLAEDPRDRTDYSAASSPQPSSSQWRRRRGRGVSMGYVGISLLHASTSLLSKQTKRDSAVDFCFDRSQVITVSAATWPKCHFADR